MMGDSRTQPSFATPWRVEPHSFSIYSDGVSKGPARVADMRGWGYLTGKGDGALGLSEDEAVAIQKANAAFIVEAVNSHTSLKARVEELEGAMIQIKIVCVDNAATTVRHDLALEFVGGIASAALSQSSGVARSEQERGNV